METDKETEMIKLWKDRAEKFYSDNVKIHIITKDQIWITGIITRLWKDGFDVQDIRRGYFPISYFEIYRFDKYMDQKK